MQFGKLWSQNDSWQQENRFKICQQLCDCLADDSGKLWIGLAERVNANRSADEKTAGKEINGNVGYRQSSWILIPDWKEDRKWRPQPARQTKLPVFKATSKHYYSFVHGDTISVETVYNNLWKNITIPKLLTMFTHRFCIYK